VVCYLTCKHLHAMCPPCAVCWLSRYVAIGSKTVQGKAWLNNSVQDFAYQSYNICCGKGDVWGDGVTPLECALGETGKATSWYDHACAVSWRWCLLPWALLVCCLCKPDVAAVHVTSSI
jgi:hypothetical protein